MIVTGILKLKMTKPPFEVAGHYMAVGRATAPPKIFVYTLFLIFLLLSAYTIVFLVSS